MKKTPKTIVCLICKIELLATHGLQKYCDPCKEIAKLWQAHMYLQNNKERVKELKRAQRNKPETKEKLRLYGRNYYAINRTKVLAYQAEYRARPGFSEEMSNYLKNYYQENRERLRQHQNAKNAQNPQKARDRALAWYIENTERAKDYQSEYAKTPSGKESARRGRVKRQSIVSQSPGLPVGFARSLTAEICYMPWCQNPADTIDHLTPFARGGMDEPDNVAGACRSCNSRKNARDPEDYFGDHYLAAIEAAFIQQDRAWGHVALLGEAESDSA